MIGKLDPEENVMDECVSGSSWISDLHKALDALQWKHGEKITVEIGRNPTISSQPFPEGEFKPHHGINKTK